MVIWSLQETIRQTTSRSKLEFLFPAKNATKKFKDFVIKKDFFLLTVLVFLSHNKRKAFINFLSNYFKTSMMIHAKNHPPTDHPAVCLLCLVNFGRYYTIYTFSTTPRIRTYLFRITFCFDLAMSICRQFVLSKYK